MANITTDAYGSTISRGAHGKTDVSSHKAPLKYDDAKFGRIKTVTDGITDLTGSLAGNSGFIVTTAGAMEITPTEGDALAASVFTAKTLYEIGVQRISGSGTIHVIY
jgi:hypothetical protein|tara:strand:+ start:489 stop:809 length:321 start_codon:yes stop_codon:yes gene_type:complete